MKEERKTLDERAQMTDLERLRHSAVARPCDGDLEDLAGSAVRRRAAGRERVLLRCRSSAPHLARRFRENRGRDEEGDQSEPSVRAHGSFARRGVGARQRRASRCAK